MINFYIKNQELSASQPIIAADTINYLQAQFFFKSSDWSGLDKWAHFKQGDTVYDVELVNDKIEQSQWLNLGAGTWEVYIHGNKIDGETVEQRVTTNVAFLVVEKSGVLDGEPLPTITPSAGEQILAKADNAVEVAQSVRDDADDGKFTATATVGKTETSEAGTPASVENVGTPQNAIFDFTIPQGFAPIATVEKQDTTTTITITDINGTTTAEVNDGESVPQSKTNWGTNAESTNGGAIGQFATTANGGAVGWEATSAGGGAVGYDANASEGGAVGYAAKTKSGGAVGYSATSAYGGAVGYKAKAYSINGSAFGRYASVAETDDETIQLGSTTTSALRCKVALTVTSDKRDKTDIVPLVNSIDFLKKLEPVTYVANPREEYIAVENRQPDDDGGETEEYKKFKKYGLCNYDVEAHANGTKKGSRRRCGLLAQDVMKAIKETYGTDNYADIVNDNFYDLGDNKPTDVENKLTLAYSNLVPFLIDAVKKLNEKCENLQNQIDGLTNG